jgi:hypothetical protein
MIRIMNDDDVELRADRILAQNIELVEHYWLRAGREGMGRRYVEVVEVPRPDGLVVFAFRRHPWAELPEPPPWDEATIVVVIRLTEGTAVRSIPCPAND